MGTFSTTTIENKRKKSILCHQVYILFPFFPFSPFLKSLKRRQQMIIMSLTPFLNICHTILSTEWFSPTLGFFRLCCIAIFVISFPFLVKS